MNKQYDLLMTFTARVARMRAAQKEFQKTHSSRDLEMKNKLERAVDDGIIRLRVTDFGRFEQPSFFDDKDGDWEAQ